MRTYLFYLFLILMIGWKVGNSATAMVKEVQAKRSQAVAHALQDLE